MAVLELEEIKQIINNGRPEWVKQAIIEHERLQVHVNGKGTAGYLQQIDGIESAAQLSLRKKFLTTNRYIMTNISRPIDKVFSAKGGGNIYNITQVPKDKLLRGKLSNVRHGKSIRNWIKDIQSNKYYTDPAGLVFFEWDKEDTWPTIKSIKSIQDYLSNGRTLEWVCFEPFKRKDTNGDDIPGEFYRVVDDAFDYLFHKNDKVITQIEDETFKNVFSEVPAIINSDIVNTDLTYNESPFEIIISLADHYLRTGTIKNLNEFLHGYPIFWRYLTDCPVCKGAGQLKGENCNVCRGTGKNLTKDVTDIIQLVIPENEGDPTITPDVAGYVTPDIVSWQEMRTEQEYVHGLMELTLWGSRMVKDATNETATAAFLNVQPVNDRLNSFTDAYQDMEKKMTDFIGTYYLTTYEGSSINYGRRYLVEPPDVIWKKYETARESGSAKVSLDHLLMQFYHSEFANDLESLTIAQKGILLEPFVHKTDEEIKGLVLGSEWEKQKYFFNEWFKTLDKSKILSLPVEKLANEFITYLKTIDYGTDV